LRGHFSAEERGEREGRDGKRKGRQKTNGMGEKHSRNKCLVKALPSDIGKQLDMMLEMLLLLYVTVV